jgi:hypothetical protein
MVTAIAIFLACLCVWLCMELREQRWATRVWASAAYEADKDAMHWRSRFLGCVREARRWKGLYERASAKPKPRGFGQWSVSGARVKSWHVFEHDTD